MITLLAATTEVPRTLPPWVRVWRTEGSHLYAPDGTRVDTEIDSPRTLLTLLHREDIQRLVLLRPYGVRLLPHVPELDQESVDIRSASELVRTEKGWLARNRLWRALLRLLPMKGKHITILGSGHVGRTALYAARRAGARSVVLVTRRDALSIHRVLDVFTLSWHPVLPVQERIQQTDILIDALPVPPPIPLTSYLPDHARVVLARLVQRGGDPLFSHPHRVDGWTLLREGATT